MKSVRIATRSSPLALWQANHVRELIRKSQPGLEVSLVEMTTMGDRFLKAPLSEVGGKGLFVKEIEQALLDGNADIAVHSLKDMTSQMPGGLCLAAFPEREDPQDAWVSARGVRFSEIPHGAQVGTASLRRSCQLLEKRPDLRIESMRGNVQTRLQAAVDRGYVGVVLALAGLRRLGLESKVTDVLSIELCLPAVGQGVLGIQCRKDDREVRALLQPLDHSTTRHAVVAERAFLAALEGGCSVPLAGYATAASGSVHLRGLIGSPDGRRVIRKEGSASIAGAEELGRTLARQMLAEGGEEILGAHR